MQLHQPISPSSPSLIRRRKNYKYKVRMALLHRALIAWFVALVFLILLVLQLDHRTQWSWFLVFIPIWFWDCLIIVLLAHHFITLARTQHLSSKPWYFLKKLVTLMSPILLKITFQCLICQRLDYPPASAIPLYYLFIPLWLLLSVAMVKLSRVLLPVFLE